ncbi:MAG: holo-ACP synthase [Caldimicrobium sp.]|nr:holo-ACP synthase [Caldimicrobium sp.]
MNPIGVGIDLVFVPRLTEIYQRYGERFLKRVFTEEEIKYAFKKRNPFYSLASAMAAKEAYYKAVGGYFPFKFKEISLMRDKERGFPRLDLSGKALEIFKKLHGEKILLSISHDFNYTIAIVHIFGRK